MAWSAIAFTLLSLLLTAAGGATRSIAYPIAPVPLRELVEKADVIATVRVRATQGETSPRPEWVLLDVERSLKGDPGPATIMLHLNRGVVCPMPASYDPGTGALAFLARWKDGPTPLIPSGWTTFASSYGSKTLDDAALALYVERVKEQLAIVTMPEGPERLAAQVAWLVRCAEQPATRWEGAYELAPAGDPMSCYDEERSTPFTAELSVAQRRRLLDALLTADRFEKGEKCLEHLFRDDRDPRLLAWLIARLRITLDRDVDIEWGEEAAIADRLAYRDPRPPIRELATALHETFSSRDPKARRRLAAERRRLVNELLALFPQ